MKKIEITNTKEYLYYDKLDNGLEVYIIPNNKINNFYLTLNTKYGSVYTNFNYDGKNYNIPKGVAHYLEHLMFKMPEKDAFDYFSELGSSVNAYTSFSVTCYEVFASSKYKENLEYLLEYVYTPYFTKELVNGERGIITEEIKMYEDDPNAEEVYGIYHNIFNKDEHKYLISGTVEDVKKIKLEDIDISYKAFYHPENMFLIATGDVDPNETLAIISEKMKTLKFNKYIKPDVKVVKESKNVNKEYREKEMFVDKPKVSFGLKVPRANFKSLKLDEIDIRLYINLIVRSNFGVTSQLNEELQSSSIINEPIDYLLLVTEDYYVLSFMVSTDYPEFFIKRMKEVFDKLEITNEEVIRKRNGSISNLIMSFDNPEIISTGIQDDIIEFNIPIVDIYNRYKNMDLETAEKIILKLKKHEQSVLVIKPKQ